MTLAVELRTHNRSQTSQRLTAAEFFAGIGLVRLALERQRWRVLDGKESSAFWGLIEILKRLDKRRLRW